MKIIAFTSLLLAASASAAGHESSEDGMHDAKAKSSKLFKSSKSDSKSSKSKGSKSSTSKGSKGSSDSHGSAECTDFLGFKADSKFMDKDDNKCAGAKIALANKLCVDIGVQPQAGANVTKGYKGEMEMGDIVPNKKPYIKSSMCPVNVHWHLGTEHYSAGEYDENGDGPHGGGTHDSEGDSRLLRALSAGEVRDGFRCGHYDADDAKFTAEYAWQHCKDMEVGETYEVHWPHSAVGACGMVNQYQTPFYDGVFCNLSEEDFGTLGPQAIASNVGVHAQVFTIVNDEEYFYPDMMRGMVTDVATEMGQDLAKYTGSTTGTSRDNTMCSQYSPITWQVDRKCHMISASSFDKMCYEMKMQRDDMSDDLHAHGSRELVDDEYVANNQADRKKIRKLVDDKIRKNIRA